MKMPRKKRISKKDLKRKLRKDIKKRDNKVTKVDKSKTEKQVLDKQTLQQIMMAQMMSSRNRVSNGENTSWITTQNQAITDKIQQQQKINALKTEKQEWERRAKNIEENEKYKEMIEKYKHEVEDHKKAVEQLEKLGPLKEQLRELEAQKAELERKLNDPLNQMQLDKTNLENYIKHLKETTDAKDPEYKEMSSKIAEAKVTLKKMKEREQLIETRNQLNTELASKRSELKAAFKQLRKIYPKELGGVQYNATNLSEILQELTDNKVTEINNYEAQIKRLNEQQQLLEKYEQLIKEFNDKKSKVNVSIEYFQEKYPDLLKDVKLDSKNIDEIILDLTNKAVIEIDDMNKHLEMLKETSNEMKILNQTKANRDMHEENFKRKHPSFVPIYDEYLSLINVDRTVKDETNAFMDAFDEYREQLKDNIAIISKADDELDKQPDDTSKEDELAVAQYGPGRE